MPELLKNPGGYYSETGSTHELAGDVVVYHPEHKASPGPEDFDRYLPLPLDSAFNQATELVNEYKEIRGNVFIEAPNKPATLISYSEYMLIIPRALTRVAQTIFSFKRGRS